MQKRHLFVGALIVLAAALCSQAQAASFSCGRYMQREFPGLLPKGINFNRALEWGRLRHTQARVGAVVVQRRSGRALGGGPGGHVSKIVELRGSCRALVRDNAGTYERDICRRLVAYVQP